eukprot:Awhi_evm1s8918
MCPIIPHHTFRCQWRGCTLSEKCSPFFVANDLTCHAVEHLYDVTETKESKEIDNLKTESHFACGWGECTSLFTTISLLERHMFQKHVGGIACRIHDCTDLFGSYVALERHMTKCHTFFCEFTSGNLRCNVKFTTENAHRAHAESHPGGRCEFCNHKNLNFYETVLHSKYHHFN